MNNSNGMCQLQMSSSSVQLPPPPPLALQLALPLWVFRFAPAYPTLSGPIQPQSITISQPSWALLWVSKLWGSHPQVLAETRRFYLLHNGMRLVMGLGLGLGVVVSILGMEFKWLMPGPPPLPLQISLFRSGFPLAAIFDSRFRYQFPDWVHLKQPLVAGPQAWTLSKIIGSRDAQAPNEQPPVRSWYVVRSVTRIVA